MPPVHRGQQSVQLKSDSFITSLRETRNTVRELKNIKKKLENNNSVYEDIVL
jgi:hypothetical protein